MKVELGELNRLYSQLGEANQEFHEQKQRKTEEKLASMEHQVEEKIKKRKKLTTEDLLIFQQQAELEEKKKK